MGLVTKGLEILSCSATLTSLKSGDHIWGAAQWLEEKRPGEETWSWVVHGGRAQVPFPTLSPQVLNTNLCPPFHAWLWHNSDFSKGICQCYFSPGPKSLSLSLILMLWQRGCQALWMNTANLMPPEGLMSRAWEHFLPNATPPKWALIMGVERDGHFWHKGAHWCRMIDADWQLLFGDSTAVDSTPIATPLLLSEILQVGMLTPGLRQWWMIWNSLLTQELWSPDEAGLESCSWQLDCRQN